MITTRTQSVRHRRADFLGLAATLVVGAVPAARADVIGPYVGGAIGQGRIDTGNLTLPAAPPFTSTPTSIGSFTENHSAYKLVAGIRAIAVVGAEVEYLDLGHPSRSFSSSSVSGTADVKMRGGGAYGMVYLPVPVANQRHQHRLRSGGRRAGEAWPPGAARGVRALQRRRWHSGPGEPRSVLVLVTRSGFHAWTRAMQSKNRNVQRPAAGKNGGRNRQME